MEDQRGDGPERNQRGNPERVHRRDGRAVGFDARAAVPAPGELDHAADPDPGLHMRHGDGDDDGDQHADGAEQVAANRGAGMRHALDAEDEQERGDHEAAREDEHDQRARFGIRQVTARVARAEGFLQRHALVAVRFGAQRQPAARQARPHDPTGLARQPRQVAARLADLAEAGFTTTSRA